MSASMDKSLTREICMMLQHACINLTNFRIFLCICAALTLGDHKVEYIKKGYPIWNISRHPLRYEAFREIQLDNYGNFVYIIVPVPIKQVHLMQVKSHKLQKGTIYN